jgi:hypothetical protein
MAHGDRLVSGFRAESLKQFCRLDVRLAVGSFGDQLDVGRGLDPVIGYVAPKRGADIGDEVAVTLVGHTAAGEDSSAFGRTPDLCS